MVKVWSDDDPKAGLMARKREAIVEAALKAFLDSGYAESSVNRIAADAGVSIKTLYRHFENKDDLFSAVMEAACSRSDDEAEAGAGPSSEPSWFSKTPRVALPMAGRQYLRHVLSEEQLSLYRVVVRDSHRFPELGRRYQEQVIGGQEALFVGYLDRWIPSAGWKVKNKRGAARVFAGLLKAGLFDDVLHGGRTPHGDEIAAHAREAAERMLTLLESNEL